MKGLEYIPSEKDLEKAYEVLQSKKILIDVQKLVLYIQWTRFDPRLGEIVIIYLKQNWKTINPSQLNGEILKANWPAALGVVCEHVRRILTSDERKQFDHWSIIALSDVPQTSGEQFFIGLFSPGGKLMGEQAEKSLKIYSRWGYLASQPMFNKVGLTNKTLASQEIRLAILKNMTRKYLRLTVADYLSELNYTVSRRQAQRDFRTIKTLK